jgi:hypothetical protein
MRTVLSLCLLGLLLCGCPGDESDNKKKPGPSGLNPIFVIGPVGGSPDPDGGANAALVITGQVTFDRLPVTASGLGSTATVLPAVNVLVEAVRHNDMFDVIATTTTDTAGNYTLNLNLNYDFYMRARTISGTGVDIDRVYHNQTSPPIPHAAVGSILNRAAGGQTVNLHALSSLTQNRAGAFAILDTVQRLRAAAAATFPSLGGLDIYWSEGGNLATGTDEFGPNARPLINLAGGTRADPGNTDHDEFDEGVIAHEWASFLQLTQSRDNNFGGVHFGEELLFTSAYSEGVVTAIGMALLGDPLYRDTLGYPGGTTSLQFEFHCESGVIPGTGVGYGNEFRVTRATWDLFDGGTGSPADGDADPGNIALGDFLASFADLQARAAPYEVAWMASLLQELIDDARLTIADANTIMTAQGGQFPPSGGADPFPAVLVVGAAATNGSLDAWSGANPNPILGPQANGVWRFELAVAQTVTIDVINNTGGYSSQAHRLDLQLIDLQRNTVAQHTGNAADKSITVNLAAGTYIVRVQHLPASQASSAPVAFSVQAS